MGHFPYTRYEDNIVHGGKEDDITLGLNWYFNPNTKLMFNCRTDLPPGEDALLPRADVGHSAGNDQCVELKKYTFYRQTRAPSEVTTPIKWRKLLHKSNS
ncbi:MAG: porin [Planctomycetota bacterium]